VVQVKSFTASGIDHDLWCFVILNDTIAETLSKEVVVAGRKELSARGDRFSIVAGVARPFLIREQKVQVAFARAIERVVLCTARNAGANRQRVEANWTRQDCFGGR
jgi:hypothetical protein